ncbi:XrtA system polysaccharide deacetylase [Roseateles depolymerans]|uniref:Polysaccharide deactylase family protein, pep-cterm locus subfamily n=1 Tax=Roseateles depolymerans TaxID=76731 RepID=A0A0U3LMY8_9BURK|nr:Polysaccharide deactylase family protein, pep-cterm locus subfamily [Roseateles depolymerans]REG19265.1 polysaccharide deacetylase family protein (PEP-CTERM system associated) [Roseateles depolymerans]
MTTPASAERPARSAMSSSRIRNAMSIDVEDYFQVSAFAPYIQRGDWDRRECRVQRNVGRILDLLDARGVKATFFTLGWIAQRYPQLVRDIVARGHELASHGYGHERASDLTPQAFRQDILSAKQLLEDLGGVAVNGYRAPSFSIGESNLWAFDVVADCGYRYSSSVYPIEHDHYGMPDSPRFAYEVRPGLIEVPVTTLRFRGRNYPSSGGGWFRLLPYGVTRWMIERFNRIEGRSAVFYFHPWEIDPEQPRIEGIDAKTRFRHYVNIGRTEGRIAQLLADFEWARMDELFLPPAADRREAA